MFCIICVVNLRLIGKVIVLLQAPKIDPLTANILTGSHFFFTFFAHPSKGLRFVI